MRSFYCSDMHLKSYHRLQRRCQDLFIVTFFIITINTTKCKILNPYCQPPPGAHHQGTRGNIQKAAEQLEERLEHSNANKDFH